MAGGLGKTDYSSTWKLPLLSDYIRKWAALTPDNDALVSADTGEIINYREFDELTDLYALRLKAMGLEKGEIAVVQFLAIPEFYLLVYGCLKAGVIISPIDVKLQAHEVLRDLNKVEAKAFFCPGKTPVKDFTEIAWQVKKSCSFVEHIVQWTPEGFPEEVVLGALSFDSLFGREALNELAQDADRVKELQRDYAALTTRDPALIIFTTGTTGEPKPALMCHENIITNNAVASRGVGLYGTDFRLLNIMPTSHVAGTAQGPMTAWFVGGAIATMGFFHPEKALADVARYKITFFGGVPTHFRMIWALPNYKEFDLSSLKYSLYGGSAVDTAFLRKMADMSPMFGTALGMTECAGYFACTPKGISVEEMAGQVGQYYPDLATVTIRKPMNGDGTAGDIMPPGEPGEICVQGGVVFLGYYNNPEATAACISKEGILYTGDMGYLRDMGTYEALTFSGRRKFVIKPKGYLVFPDEVTDFITRHPAVNQAQVVGVPHNIYSDGVFAFVQPNPDADITPEEILDYCKGIASYKRPIHVEMWPTDRQFPVNRVNKVDSLALMETAETITHQLRAQGKWDA